MNTNVYTTVGIFTVGSVTQTIADLHTFESQNALPTINPTVVTVGGTSTDTSGTLNGIWTVRNPGDGGRLREHDLLRLGRVVRCTNGGYVKQIVSDDLAKVINVSIEDCEIYPHADGAMASDDVTLKWPSRKGRLSRSRAATGGRRNAARRQWLFLRNGCGGSLIPPALPYVIAVGGTTFVHQHQQHLWGRNRVDVQRRRPEPLRTATELAGRNCSARPAPSRILPSMRIQFRRRVSSPLACRR